MWQQQAPDGDVVRIYLRTVSSAIAQAASCECGSVYGQARGHVNSLMCRYLLETRRLKYSSTAAAMEAAALRCQSDEASRRASWRLLM